MCEGYVYPRLIGYARPEEAETEISEILGIQEKKAAMPELSTHRCRQVAHMVLCSCKLRVKSSLRREIWVMLQAIIKSLN